MAAKKTLKGKTTATKTPKPKSTKAAKPLVAAAQPADECPRGGAHEWTENEGGRFGVQRAGWREDRKGKGSKKREEEAFRHEEHGKLSQLDAAATVLGEKKQRMNTNEIVGAIGQKGYLTSPGARRSTPRSTAPSCGDRREGERSPVHEDRAREVQARLVPDATSSHTRPGNGPLSRLAPWSDPRARRPHGANVAFWARGSGYAVLRAP